MVGCGWELDHCDLTEATGEDAVRKRLSEVYRKFKVPGSGPEAEQTAAASRIRYQEHPAQRSSGSSSTWPALG